MNGFKGSFDLIDFTSGLETIYVFFELGFQYFVVGDVVQDVQVDLLVRWPYRRCTHIKHARYVDQLQIGSTDV